MNITLTMQFATIEEMRAFLAGSNGLPIDAPPVTLAETRTEPVAAEPPKTRKPRAKKSEAEKVETEDAESLTEQVKEVEATVAPEPERQESTKPPTAVPTVEDVRAAILVLLKAKGQAVAAAELAKFGFKSASAIPEEKRNDVIAALISSSKAE